MTPTDKLRALLDERGIEHETYDLPNGEHGVSWTDCNGIEWEAVQQGENFEIHALQLVTPEQAIAATAGKGKAKSHPWGYEAETGFFDVTRCECGEMNDISAKYCNQCGREIELDMSEIEYAEDWYVPQHTCKVNADGTLTSLRDGKTYVDAATAGNRTDLSKRLREVHGLHAFAELFGFDWSDESDWSWHDVACAMADAIDATVGVGTCQRWRRTRFGLIGECDVQILRA